MAYSTLNARVARRLLHARVSFFNLPHYANCTELSPPLRGVLCSSRNLTMRILAYNRRFSARWAARVPDEAPSCRCHIIAGQFSE